jgi:hypothetical protein
MLKGDTSGNDSESFLAVATSDYFFIIMRLTKGAPHSNEVLASIENAHSSDITAILALTDNFSSLSFVTLSLDSSLKIFGVDGELEYETTCDG